MQCPCLPQSISSGFVEEHWVWDVNAKSPAVQLSPCQRAVYFHIDPILQSEGTAGVRGTKGMDSESWGLSYKGTVWHCGQSRQYTEPFYEKATIIGVDLNLYDGTMAFYKNGLHLGVAFTGLNKVGVPLYPIVSSTAAETELELVMRSCRFLSLQEQCLYTVLQHLVDEVHIDTLPLPGFIRRQLKEF
ncbi:SPRY domain-containing SOCS box protein 3 isoform X2 [Pristis pectinata]|uniref:SPRY domain-containing SOCS box protein 3 isoform X2 n=1 Tax=Pristis pectinata TaxID=685728 RepID=UPI00223E4235|nr:SPRY domain-containing SOCS box protein 3 isoform X2 [Pristis pectinata]